MKTCQSIKTCVCEHVCVYVCAWIYVCDHIDLFDQWSTYKPISQEGLNDKIWQSLRFPSLFWVQWNNQRVSDRPSSKPDSTSSWLHQLACQLQTTETIFSQEGLLKASLSGQRAELEVQACKPQGLSQARPAKITLGALCLESHLGGPVGLTQLLWVIPDSPCMWPTIQARTSGRSIQAAGSGHKPESWRRDCLYRSLLSLWSPREHMLVSHKVNSLLPTLLPAPPRLMAQAYRPPVSCKQPSRWPTSKKHQLVDISWHVTHSFPEWDFFFLWPKM